MALVERIHRTSGKTAGVTVAAPLSRHNGYDEIGTGDLNAPGRGLRLNLQRWPTQIHHAPGRTVRAPGRTTKSVVAKTTVHYA
jgi:hypothetical protein